MTTTEKIDAALDSVLAACGSDLKTVHENTRHYKPSTKDDMREAMRKIMSDSYIAGSNDAQKAMKIKQEPWQMPESMKRAHDAMKGK